MDTPLRIFFLFQLSIGIGKSKSNNYFVGGYDSFPFRSETLHLDNGVVLGFFVLNFFLGLLYFERGLKRIPNRGYRKPKKKD